MIKKFQTILLCLVGGWWGGVCPGEASGGTPPVVAAVWPVPGGTLTNLTQVMVGFSEAVLNVDAEDLLVNGVSALAVTNSGTAYWFTLATPPAGELQVAFSPNNEIFDLAGNAFDAGAPGNSWSYTLVDKTPPTVTGVGPAPGARVTRLDTVEVVFSEPVLGVEARDLLVNGVATTNVTGTGLGPYRFTFPPAGEGPVEFRWAADHEILDLADAANAFAGVSWTNLLVSSNTAGTVIINEFMANNASTLTNEFGQTEDWIELFNAGSNSVSLLGWALTDDPSLANAWMFPDIALEPGGYLLVYADGRDIKTGTHLHANFKLNEQGDYLALCNADFPRQAVCEFSPQFPEQRPDYSYGLTASGNWGYFAKPTPGRANGESSIAGVTPLPHVNADRGIYLEPFTLIASCPLPEAVLRYTKDGSTPTEQNGYPLTGPIGISNTTIFRLAAFATNRLPSQVLTHSYIFIDKVMTQPRNPPGYPVGSTVWSGYPSDYEMDPEIVTNNAAWVKDSLRSLPSVVLTMKVDDLFGATNGIYTHPEETNRPLWERACSVEFILTNGATGFQMDCGVRIQGNASRTPLKTPKHSFRLLCKDAYGPGRLNYALFPGAAVQSFNGLVLRADYNNSWLHGDGGQRQRGTLIRDVWTKETSRAMNGISGHSLPFHLYLNGLYWGVYNFGERIDAEFAASYLGGTAEEWDAIASKPTEAIDGDLNAYTQMVNFGRRVDMRQPTNYLAMQTQLDLPVFLDYMVLNFYGANLDWDFDGNWNALHRRLPGETFKYVVWDAEQMMVNLTDNVVTNASLPSGLHTNLVRSSQYRMDFADRAHKHCFNGGLLTPEPAAARWMELAHGVEAGMLGESARWGDYRRDVHAYYSGPYNLCTTSAYWWPEIRRMQTNYFPARTEVFLGQLRNAGLYPTVSAPVFSPSGGRVRPGTILSMTASNTIYFTTNGTDPRVAFSGMIAPEAMVYTGAVTLAGSVLVKARALWQTNWSALNEAYFDASTLSCPVHITEIMYNPVGGEAYEFLELRNDGNTWINLSGWSFAGITYMFPAGTLLSPGQIYLLANKTDTNAFATRYPQARVDGYFTGKLSNGGERIALLDAAGRIQLAVDYDDDNGWPTAADGGGCSLEIIDPFGDPEAPSNWSATHYNGTPGMAPLSAPALPIVRLNEIMAENQTAVEHGGIFPDWVELYNGATQAVSLADWSLSDDGNARKYVFPSNVVIQPGGCLVVWCDGNLSAEGLHTGFTLNRDGETLALFDPGANRVDALTFGMQVPDFSIGRVNGAWTLTVPTPGTDNLAAETASQTNLCFNEWLANAPPGGSDWIELYNRALEPVPLRGLFLTPGNGQHQLASLSFVRGQGFALLQADALPGANHLNFKLPAEGGVLVMTDELGTEIDRVSYGPQVPGISAGRFPDGAATVTNFLMSPSPGAANYIPAYLGPRLNELMALNHTTLTNAAGQTPDWIELYNPAPTNYVLTGWRLSTTHNNPQQWTFPAGVVMVANSYLVIWFDTTRPASATNETELNIGHALNGDGESVNLFTPEGLLVDGVVFGPQAPDYSLGRVDGAWRLLARATPGASNSEPAVLASATNLVLNEWLAQPIPPDAAFLEIFNRAADPVELSGLFLTDELSLTEVAKFQIAPLSFAGPRGFTRFKADADTSKGANHLNFMLDAQGGSARLSGANTTLDTICYGPQQAGFSEGRLPDGENGWSTFACPTPGASNGLAGLIWITAQPADQAAEEGTNATFTVGSSSAGSYGFQWLFNGIPMPGANSGTLYLWSVQPGSSGSYSVVLTNNCMALTSAVATLIVATNPFGAWPRILENPANRTVTVGEMVSFAVRATSDTGLSYLWSWNGMPLWRETNAVLVIARVTATNAGSYQVEVRNAAGSVTSLPASLTVAAAPSLGGAKYMGNGMLELTVNGQPWRTYSLEWSTNLRTWSNAVSLIVTQQPQTWLQTAQTNEPKRFFRVRLLPP